MDFFKQSLAPITKEAWQAINQRAEAVIKALLTTRKSLKIDGPHGLNKTSVSKGRLNLLENKSSKNVKVGLYEVQSLLETRVTFTLSRWELDNIIRGAKDIDLDALENAVAELVLFEENTVFNGNSAVGIKGLLKEAGHSLELGEGTENLLNSIVEGTVLLKKSFAERPYNLHVGKALNKQLNQMHGSKLLRDLILKVIGGQIILSESIDGGLLLPAKHEDIEFTVGQDYTIGYESHDEKNIKLFIMNSYTLRVIDPNILVRFK